MRCMKQSRGVTTVRVEVGEEALRSWRSNLQAGLTSWSSWQAPRLLSKAVRWRQWAGTASGCANLSTVRGADWLMVLLRTTQAMIAMRIPSTTTDKQMTRIRTGGDSLTRDSVLGMTVR